MRNPTPYILQISNTSRFLVRYDLKISKMLKCVLENIFFLSILWKGEMTIQRLECGIPFNTNPMNKTMP